MMMEKITKFTPAYDKRNPDPSKNYGIGCVRCMMVLKGEKGAVHFVFGTGIFLPETVAEYDKDGRDLFHWSTIPGREHEQSYYMGYDVGYHSLKPSFDGHVSQGKCEWLGGKDCYCDGSAMRAEEWMDIFVREGSDKIWEMLEKDYETHFGSKT